MQNSLIRPNKRQDLLIGYYLTAGSFYYTGDIESQITADENEAFVFFTKSQALLYKMRNLDTEKVVWKVVPAYEVYRKGFKEGLVKFILYLFVVHALIGGAFTVSVFLNLLWLH